MSLTSKVAILVATGGFLGAAAGLWFLFGDEVYLTYMAGMIMRCF
jgi:hypothetical protein